MIAQCIVSYILSLPLAASNGAPSLKLNEGLMFSRAHAAAPETPTPPQSCFSDVTI